MALWKSPLDPYVTIIPHSSPAVLPLLLLILGLPWTVHIGIYLPTSDLEQEWVIELAALVRTIEDIKETRLDTPIFIRGDSNVNSNHQTRPKIWSDFL